MDCSDMSELFTGRHVGQWESWDMSQQSEKKSLTFSCLTLTVI